jgi:hypothetical protein
LWRPMPAGRQSGRLRKKKNSVFHSQSLQPAGRLDQRADAIVDHDTAQEPRTGHNEL